MPTKAEEREASQNRFNNADVQLKQWRDSETVSHSFVQDMNHMIEEFGQRGYSYSQINSMMGNQIAQYSRSRGDRRYLSFLDQIITPGGVWGNTKAGLKLKQITKDQMDSDENERVRSERNAFLHAKDVDQHVFKSKIADLHYKLRGSTKEEERSSIEKEIQGLIGASYESGVGDIVSNYYTNMTSHLDRGYESGLKREVTLNDTHIAGGKTYYEEIVEILDDPSVDTDPNKRKDLINQMILSKNIMFNKESQALVDRVISNHTNYKGTQEYAGRETVFKVIAENARIPYIKVDPKTSRIVGRKLMPVELERILQDNLVKFNEVYRDVYTKYSAELRDDVDDAKYGYKEWSSKQRGEFLNRYKEEVQELKDSFIKDIEVFEETKKNADKKEEDHEDKKDSNPVSSKAPTDIAQLQDYIGTNFSSSNAENVTSALFRINDLIIDVFEGNTDKANVNTKWLFEGNDFLDWWEASIGGSTDDVVKREKAGQIWEWSKYIILRDSISKISASNIPEERKAKKIKRFTKTINELKLLTDKTEIKEALKLLGIE